jgi:hypothetical protein
MSKRRAESNPVSLFPFLAVLLSAMGALILLLVVVSRQAQRSRDLEHRAAAIRELAELPPLPERLSFPSVEPLAPLDLPPVDPPNLPPLPEIKDRRPALQAEKKKLEAELQQWSQPAVNPPDASAKQDRLSQLQARLIDLERQLREIEKAKAMAEKEKDSARQLIQDLDARWSKAKANADMAENRFSIVPYFGGNGSDRQPVYIECQRDRMILQPHGIEIRPADLGNPLDPENTLAAILRAVLAYSRGKGEQPYPLLVVRPDGITTYYIARIALTPVRVEYGYELVTREMNLDFGTADPQTKQIAQAIVDQSKSMVRRRPGPAPAKEWDLDAADQGPSGDPTTIRDLRTMRSPTREELESLARGLPSVAGPSGDDDLENQAGRGARDAGRSAAWSSRPSTRQGNQGLDLGQGSASRPQDSGRSGSSAGDLVDVPSGEGMGSRQTPGNSTRPLPSSAADRLSDLGVSRSLAAARGQRGSGMPAEAREPAMIGGSSDPADPVDRRDRSVNADSFDDESVPAEPTLRGQTPGERNPAEQTDDRLYSLGQPTPGKDLAQSARSTGSPQPNTNDRRARSTGSSGWQSPSSTRATGSPSASASSPPGTASGKKSGLGPPPKGAVAGQTSSAGAGVSAGTPNEFQKALMEAAGGSSSAATTDGMPMPALQFSNRKPTSNQQGEEGDSNATGPPDFGPTGTIRETVRRGVIVECRDAGITLYPGGTFIKLGSDEDLSAARTAIYRHVADQLLSWGPPSDIHRWAPFIEFNVRPDGMERYYDLRLSMIDSGIEVRKRLLSWKDDVDFSEIFGGVRPADQARKRADGTMTR